MAEISPSGVLMFSEEVITLLLGLWEGLYKTADKPLSVPSIATEPGQRWVTALIQCSHLQLRPWYDGLVKRTSFTGSDSLLSHFLTLLT